MVSKVALASKDKRVREVSLDLKAVKDLLVKGAVPAMQGREEVTAHRVNMERLECAEILETRENRVDRVRREAWVCREGLDQRGNKASPDPGARLVEREIRECLVDVD